MQEMKIDFKNDDEDWTTYVFDDCAWKSAEGTTIRLAGLYGREAEFYVITDEGNQPPAKRYNPVWDGLLEILGFC